MTTSPPLPSLPALRTDKTDNKLVDSGGKDRLSGCERLFDNLDLLTVDELAAFLGKRPQTIRNMVAMRIIPHIPGRPVRFLGSSIVTWLKSKEIKPCQ
jgi:hypothetical protein